MQIKDDLPENRTSGGTDQDGREREEDAVATFQMSCLAHFKVPAVWFHDVLCQPLLSLL